MPPQSAHERWDRIDIDNIDAIDLRLPRQRS
jgi:hypothetical protein